MVLDSIIIMDIMFMVDMLYIDINMLLVIIVIRYLLLLILVILIHLIMLRQYIPLTAIIRYIITIVLM